MKVKKSKTKRSGNGTKLKKSGHRQTKKFMHSKGKK